MLVPKLMHDFTGHYNRFDIFSLQVNTDAPPAVAFTGADAEAAQRPGDPEKAPAQQAGSSVLSLSTSRSGRSRRSVPREE